MKILFLCQMYYPHIGGVEKHVEKLSKVLTKQGHQVTIITTDHSGSLPLEEDYKQVKIYRIPKSSLNSKLKTWRQILKYHRIIKQADIIHVHDVFWWLFPEKLLISPHLKLFTTFHGYEGNEPPTWQAVVHRKFVEKISAASICVGSFMTKWYKAKPNLVIYGAADSQKIKKIEKAHQSAVYVGRLEADTGIMTYLKALRLLKSKKINLKLDVFGEGRLAKRAKNYVKKNKLKVRFHGTRADVSGVYDTAELAFVSRYLSIIEAMNASCLVIAAYNNQIKADYLECHPMAENFFITNSPAKIAKDIEQLYLQGLIDSSQMSQKIQDAAKWSTKQTWGLVADHYHKLWSGGQ